MKSYVFETIIDETKEGAIESENIVFTKCVLRALENNNNKLVNTLEIGILNGERCHHFLNIHPMVKHIGIDPIIPDSMASNLIGNKEIISKNTHFAKNRFKFINDYCEKPSVVNSIEDNSIDFVFIDGDHRYDCVKRDFQLYYNKVKCNRFIGIHDSRMYRGGANFHPGPSKFTDELIAGKYTSYNLKLVAEAFSLTVFEKY
jgi:hypothetical protein